MHSFLVSINSGMILKIPVVFFFPPDKTAVPDFSPMTSEK